VTTAHGGQDDDQVKWPPTSASVPVGLGVGGDAGGVELVDVVDQLVGV